jgi:hypothetical protein
VFLLHLLPHQVLQYAKLWKLCIFPVNTVGWICTPSTNRNFPVSTCHFPCMCEYCTRPKSYCMCTQIQLNQHLHKYWCTFHVQVQYQKTQHFQKEATKKTPKRRRARTTVPPDWISLQVKDEKKQWITIGKAPMESYSIEITASYWQPNNGDGSRLMVRASRSPAGGRGNVDERWRRTAAACATGRASDRLLFGCSVCNISAAVKSLTLLPTRRYGT